MENIGKVFLDKRGNRNNVVEIVDKLTTYNSKGEIVRECYVGAHEFMGCTIKKEYPLATIERWKCNNCELHKGVELC